jgi:hypothetical protein
MNEVCFSETQLVSAPDETVNCRMEMVVLMKGLPNDWKMLRTEWRQIPSGPSKH